MMTILNIKRMIYSTFRVGMLVSQDQHC